MRKNEVLYTHDPNCAVGADIVVYADNGCGRIRAHNSASLAVNRVLLAFALSITLYALSAGSLQAATYPNGARDPDEWYYCHAFQISAHSSTVGDGPWSDLTCEHLLWINEPGGGGDIGSVQMEGFVQVIDPENDGEARRLWGMIVPPQGMKTINYECDAFASACHDGGSGSLAGNTISSASTTRFSHDSTTWSVSASVPTTANTCNQASLNVVASFRAVSYDNYWADDIVAAWNIAPNNLIPLWQASGNTINDNRIWAGGWSCKVTNFASHATWLATNPEWVPEPGDMIPTPTPPPTGTWIPEPWVPITDSEFVPIFELGPGEDGGCSMIIPQQSITIGENQYGWYGFEVCRTDFALSLSIFNEDVNYWLNVALSLGGLAIVFSIIKRS